MKQFFALIDQLNASSAADHAAIEARIWAAHGVERAVMTLDMSNFSMFVRRNGILPYLCKIRRMHQATEPVVRSSHGEVVKYEADNLMAVFADCGDAVAAAVRINHAIAGVGSVAADAAAGEQLAVSIGIDYGRFLLIPGEDCYGDAVNRAFKLGEDVARAGEILITEEVRKRLGDSPPYGFRQELLSVSGIEMIAFRVQYETTDADTREANSPGVLTSPPAPPSA